jgi:hypothetical protein
VLVLIRNFTDLFDAFAGRNGLRHALAKLFQESMTAFHDPQDEFPSADMREHFHGGQSLAGMGDVRTQPLGVIGENLAAFATTRDADVKLLLMDGGQRPRRRHDQHFIHRFALGGVRRDGVAVGGESLIRFASCVLCGSSKQLEELAMLERDGEFSGQLRGKLGRLLEDITGGEIRTLDDIGIISNPRSVLVHGPLKLCLDGAWLDFGILHGSFRLSQTDIERAEKIESSSLRCTTIENETTFHELAKLQSGELLICTSYPGSGTVALLRRLPPKIDCRHFGDSDEAGFEILRVLRDKSGRDFRPLHMQVGRIPFEQESLGRPTHRTWPFYRQ